MVWYQVRVESCPRDEIESLSDELEEEGALSVTLTDQHDDPVLEPAPGTTPLWPDVIVHALYAEQDEAEQVLQRLSVKYNHLRFAIQELPDQDWERAWMDNFKPQRFGQRLWVCPSWIEPPDPHAVNLILDPGLAFGTGTHPTTSLCLNWLGQTDLTNKTVIDYGCGSGILALATLKLGAAKVYAVDIDEQALQATQNNALNNKIDRHQLTIDFPPALQEPVDLLIANILLTPLIALRTAFRALLKERGTIILSGLLEEQVPALVEAYQPDFILQSSTHLDGWSLLIFNCRL